MIYLDYAASSPPYPQVVEKMRDIMCTSYGNASGIHPMAEKSRLIIRQSRRTLAELLEVQPQQVFFTSGATEANNWAVKSAMAAGGKRHMIIFAPEHSSVIAAARYMEARGFELTWLRPDGDGLLSSETVERAIRPDTGLLCVQAVNNETGVMQDVEAMAQLARKKGILYHCDGVQSFAHCQQPLKLPDFVSLSAHKLGGLKGSGALYVRDGLHLQPLIYGGNQENGLRSGTEAMPQIAAFGAAAAERMANFKENCEKMTALRDKLRAEAERLGCEINSPENGAPHILNLSPCVGRSEVYIRVLSDQGIYVSGGSACSRGKKSHVLTAMRVSGKNADAALRVSLCPETTEADIDAFVAALEQAKKMF